MGRIPFAAGDRSDTPKKILGPFSMHFGQKRWDFGGVEHCLLAVARQSRLERGLVFVEII